MAFTTSDTSSESFFVPASFVVSFVAFCSPSLLECSDAGLTEAAASEFVCEDSVSPVTRSKGTWFEIKKEES